jgi:hypothetical protein
LTVTGRLMISATGRVSGKIRYARIEVEPGGVILGDLGSLPQGSRARTSSQASHGGGPARGRPRAGFLLPVWCRNSNELWTAVWLN